MRPALILFLLLLYLAGCAYHTGGTRLATAPILPPSPFARLVAAPPEGAVEVGQVRAQGNNWQAPADCDAQLLVEARKLGGNAVLAVPKKSGWGKGPSCSGRVYFVAGLAP